MSKADIESVEELDKILGLYTIVDGLKKERDALKDQAEQLLEKINNYENAIAESSEALSDVTKREQDYRNKALEWCCNGFRLQPGGLSIQCSRCFRLTSDAPYCHEVINEVDSCLKY